MNKRHNMDELHEIVVKALKDRGINLEDIAEIVYDLQIEYYSDLSLSRCRESVIAILKKREAIHAILTGIAIDKVAENNGFEEPIQSIITADEGLYGVDEILALGITNLYGSIGLTNFGYLDKTKPGIIGKLDDKKNNNVNTFLDDLIAAIVAAAASRIAHSEIYE